MSMASVVDQLLDEGCSLEQLEETFITRALGKADGNVTRAAKILGLSRATLDYRLRKSRIPVGNRKGRPSS